MVSICALTTRARLKEWQARYKPISVHKPSLQYLPCRRTAGESHSLSPKTTQAPDCVTSPTCPPQLTLKLSNALSLLSLLATRLDPPQGNLPI